MSARVKSVLSGDTVVLTPVDAAPTEANEQVLSLGFVSSPRLNSNDLHGFESREYLRNLLIGKPVQFRVLYSANNRDYGDIRAPIFNSLIDKVVSDGAAKLRDDAPGKPGYAELADRLEKAQAQARSSHKGIWAADVKTVRQVGQVPEDLYGSGRQVPSVVEKIVAGDRIHLRTLMDKDFHYVGPAMLAGVRTPRTAFNDSPGEPFGDVAKTFMVTRMLQRSVRAEFVGPSPSNPAIPLVNLIYPAGDIAALLLEQGLGYVADNQAGVIGSERLLTLRNAQRKGEQSAINLWARKTPKVSSTGYEAVVLRVVSSDTFVVEPLSGGAEKTVQLSSVRAPRKNDTAQAPFVAAAREFARKLLIGKEVTVHLDAVRPASDQFEERDLVTIALDAQNAGVEIVKAGYATVVRHRRDDMDKSPFIDDLFAAETAAQEAQRGVFGKVPPSGAKIVDASETVVRARGYLASLDRRGRVRAVVEYVHGGGRLKLAVPSENCTLIAVLAGVRVPRPSEPCGDAAAEFTMRRFNQRDVQVVVENVDKTGAFISKVYLPGKQVPLQVLLAQQGLADVHEGSANAAGLREELDAAKAAAQASRLGIWQDYEPSEPATAPEVPKDEAQVEQDRFEDAFCVAVTPENVVYQLAPARERFTKLKNEMATFYNAASNTGVKFDKAPRRGELVAAKIGNDYVRGRVVAFDHDTFTIDRLDLGKQISVSQTQLRPLNAQFSAIPPLATTKPLAYIAVPPHDYVADYLEFLAETIENKRIVAQTTAGGLFVYTGDSKAADDSLNARIIDNGYAAVARSGAPPRLVGLQAAAQSDRIGMWQYGDPRDDEPL